MAQTSLPCEWYAKGPGVKTTKWAIRANMKGVTLGDLPQIYAEVPIRHISYTPSSFASSSMIVKPPFIA